MTSERSREELIEMMHQINRTRNLEKQTNLLTGLTETRHGKSPLPTNFLNN